MSKPISSYKLLCFDVYGTLVDWESGIVSAASGLLSQLHPEPTRTEFLTLYDQKERAQQTLTPRLLYSQVLAKVYEQLAQHYGLPHPSPEDAVAFGESISQWSPFSDTVAALADLHQTYRLVVLSNVDNESFKATQQKLNTAFDVVITAEDVGAYKPDVKGFNYMLEYASKNFNVAREDVLVVAQSRSHDHAAAQKIGLKSVWINRENAVMGLEGGEFNWEFNTLGAMAEAVRKEID